MKDILISAITKALANLNIEATDITLERPGDLSHGDFSTNVALVYSKQLKTSPQSLAVLIVDALKKQGDIEGIEKMEVAGPGFINFYANSSSMLNSLTTILSDSNFGKNKLIEGKKVAYEYTDPNPFKVFHIGHLMANTIGESLSRLAEYSGGQVKRFCYPGDIGRHVALALWGIRFMEEKFPSESATLSEKSNFLGKAYSTGAQKFYDLEQKATDKADDSEEKKAFKEVEQEVQNINKKIYDRSSEELNKLYDQGREWSLQHFEEIYKVLGTKFDQYIFESQATLPGLEIVKANTAPNGLSLFEESNGAIIFPGEKYGLHTRVFINRFGLATYEAKEIGLAKLKYDAYPYDIGVMVTASEQNEIFKVTLKAVELLFSDIGTKQKHVSHGMLRLTTGKMSSRKGGVISGESLLEDMKEMAFEKMIERNISEEEKVKVAEQVGVAAIKYTVLRQAAGKDIVFDAEKSLSFEGDSGPYLQYATVRAQSILQKAKTEGIEVSLQVTAGEESFGTLNWAGGKLERLLLRLPETIEHAYIEDAPHHVANYLMELAGTFNTFYANTQIVDKESKESGYKVGLVKAFEVVMQKGLWILGIKVPEKM